MKNLKEQYKRLFGENVNPIVENNSSLKTKMIKHIQGMVKYSDRLGSDEIDDLKELLRLIQKIK